MHECQFHRADSLAPSEPAIESLGSITLIAARRWNPSAYVWAGLFIAASVVAFWSLLPGPTLNNHECLVAQTSREMLDRGDWVVPYFSGMPRLQKSPLAYWSVATISDTLHRFSDPIVRLPSAIYAVALVALMVPVCATCLRLCVAGLVRRHRHRLKCRLAVL